MNENLEIFLQRGLWVLAEGLLKTSPDKSHLEKYLIRFALHTSKSGDSGFNSHSTEKNDSMIIHGYQKKCLTARLLKCTGSQSSASIALLKQAEFDCLLLQFQDSSAMSVRVELQTLLKAVTSANTAKAPPSKLSSDASEFLLNCLLLHTSQALQLIEGLLSPCCDLFTESDIYLTNLCISALEVSLQRLEQEETTEHNVGVVLQLVSSGHCKPEMLPRLKQLADRGVFPQAAIHLALAAKGGSPPQLLQAYCELEVPDSSALVTKNGTLNPKAAFIRQTASRKHWVLDLLNFWHEMLQKDELSDLIQPPLSRLFPLLILKAWEEPYCSEHAIIFLAKLCKDLELDPIFCRMISLLQRQSEVINWIKLYNPSYPLDNQTSVALSHKHSVLRILFESGSLNQRKWNEVTQLLKKTNLICGEVVSGWESTTFQAYCIMASGLNLIWESVQMETYSNSSSLPARDRRSSKTSSPEVKIEVEQDVGANQYYETLVSRELNMIRDGLRNIISLPLRMEVLENLFSLLFLRYEDLKPEEGPSDSGGEDEEEAQVCDSNHCPLTQTADFESLKSDSTSASNVFITPKISSCKPRKSESLSEAPEALDLSQKKENRKNRGFVCGPNILRDMLNCLRECLVDCSAAFYRLRGVSGRDATLADTNLQRQINKLIQYATEAWWRLQLLTDHQFMQDIGILHPLVIPPTAFPPEPQRAYPSSASSSDSDGGVRERRGQERSKRRPSYSSKQSRSDNTASSESGSNTTGAGSATSSNGQRQGRHRNRAQNKLPPESASIVRLMLASSSSLTILCLTKSQFSKAQQIVQTFKLCKTFIANEANFLEAYENLSVELSSREVSSAKSTKKTKQCIEKRAEPSSLDNIRQAASAGIQSASIMSIVERVVALAPEVQGLDTAKLEHCSASQMLAGLEGAVMASADLALTLGSSPDLSMCLLGVVTQHWKSSTHPKDNSSKVIGQSKGFANFVLNSMELFKSLKDKKILHVASEKGLPGLLINWEHPLSFKLLHENMVFWSNLEDAALHFQSEPNPSDRNHTATLRKIIKTSGEVVTYTDSRGLTQTGTVRLEYLQHLLWYLQTLSSLVTKSSQDTQQGFYSPLSVLNEGWVELLGRVVFDMGAPLSRVERVAYRLQINLLHAVVATCCPKLQLSDKPKQQSSLVHPPISWGKICLNESSSEHESGDHLSAGILASSLLSELLLVLNSATISKTLSSVDITAVAQNSNVLTVLNRTVQLSSVDLGSLTQGHDTYAFLINVTNLLYLHGLIALSPTWGLASSSWTEKKSAFNSVGYCIGQMGFVSLGSLMKQLLGEDAEPLLTAETTCDFLLLSEEKRALFAIANGTKQSPAIQVIEAEKLDQKLDAAVANYVSYFVRVDGSVKDGYFSLVIPMLVLRYLGISSPSFLEQAEEAIDEPSICLQEALSSLQTSHLARDCTTHLPSIISFLQSYVTGELQNSLTDWVDAWNCSSEENTELLVIVEEPSTQFAVVLNTLAEQDNASSLMSLVAELEDKSTSWKNRSIPDSVMQYLERHCWLVALIAKRLHQDPGEYSGTPQTACLDRLLLNHMPALAPLGDGDVMLAALQPWPLPQHIIWPIFDRLLFEHRETECVRLIMALPESWIMRDVKFQAFKDILLYHMASQPPIQGHETPWRLAMSLETAELRAKCVLSALQFWPGPESIQTLKAILGESTLTTDTYTHVANTLQRVSIYQQVLQILCYYKSTKVLPSIVLGGWHDVCKLSETDPGQVLQSLIEAKQVHLCLQWAELHGIPHRAQHLVDCNFLLLVLEPEPVDFSQAEKLLRSVPVPQVIFICTQLLSLLPSLGSLQFVVRFALGFCTSWFEENLSVKASLQLWLVGLSILAMLPESEQQRDRRLASQPHLLLEQLLMNTRLTTLGKALKALRSSDLSALAADSPALPSSIDATLRQYATKALDLRVCRRSVPEVLPTLEEDELLQSLSTGSTNSCQETFVMPQSAPAKEQWVPNDEVTECMCCFAVSFSMFNRRHHCRRCGRVVCGTCSTHRHKVEGYGDLPVRTCDDCMAQMKQQELPLDGKSQSLHSPSLPSSASSHSAVANEWHLVGQEDYDCTVREEFSYEHAPSVALCLSILALHSEHTAAQPRFLLESADGMLRLLVPPTPGFINPELDYGLVIRMARSLVVAAKVRYARAALNSGVSHCDRLLGQVDLLALLVRSGCASLLPSEPLPLGGHALRHLRDRLVAAELWSLSLDVSTKAGLERGGVWAAWGKACLRSGRWAEAREHFVHCLQPASAIDSSPAPLLSEILHILEDTNYISDPTVLKTAEKIPNPALSVLHSLSSLSAITQGKIPLGPISSSEPLFYSECQFYLKLYGSSTATLSFYLSHSDLVSALKHAKEKNIEPDVFAEALYKPCLRQGLIEELHQEMRNMDPSLDIWKTILLHVGRLLERQGWLHCLYQLQLFANDLVRAAMTCIRFYRGGARCYTDLAPEHLFKARIHLEEELKATQWSPGSKDRDKRSPSTPESTDASSPTLEAQLPLKLPARQLDHHISTICRQLEAAKFLQQCEADGRSVVAVAANLHQGLEPGTVSRIPTLFGNGAERVQLSALIILCGKNVEEGFGISFRIIQDFKLRASRVYGMAAKWLAAEDQLNLVEQLVGCIRSSGSMDSSSCSDELLLQCVNQLANQNKGGITKAETLLRLILDPGTKIQGHLVCGQLKSAYLLAVKLGRATDVRLVLREAESQGQPVMKRICLQWLAQHSQ